MENGRFSLSFPDLLTVNTSYTPCCRVSGTHPDGKFAEAISRQDQRLAASTAIFTLIVFLNLCRNLFFQNKDINKAAADTVYRLAKVLGCLMEDLMEK